MASRNTDAVPAQQLDLWNFSDADKAFYQGKLAFLAEQLIQRLLDIEASYKPVFVPTWA
jgi:hypothetical protein